MLSLPANSPKLKSAFALRSFFSEGVQIYIRFIFYKPSGKKVLQFDKTRLITGINILDDSLYFTKYLSFKNTSFCTFTFRIKFHP